MKKDFMGDNGKLIIDVVNVNGEKKRYTDCVNYADNGDIVSFEYEEKLMGRSSEWTLVELTRSNHISISYKVAR